MIGYHGEVDFWIFLDPAGEERKQRNILDLVRRIVAMILNDIKIKTDY